MTDTDRNTRQVDPDEVARLQEQVLSLGKPVANNRAERRALKRLK